MEGHNKRSKIGWLYFACILLGIAFIQLANYPPDFWGLAAGFSGLLLMVFVGTNILRSFNKS